MKCSLRAISGLNSLVVEMLGCGGAGFDCVLLRLGDFTAGEFAAFVGALLMMISPIKHLTAANEDIQIGLAAAQSVFEVIDTPAEIE